MESGDEGNLEYSSLLRSMRRHRESRRAAFLNESAAEEGCGVRAAERAREVAAALSAWRGAAWGTAGAAPSAVENTHKRSGNAAWCIA